MKWSCLNCFHVNPAANDSCESDLCVGTSTVLHAGPGRKSQTVETMVGKLDAKLSIYPVSQKPPGEIDCVSASELVQLLFSPHGVDNSGLTREAWTSPNLWLHND